MFGLTTKTIQSIQSVFAEYPQIREAVIYGSRAKGNYRNGSDIDISLKGEDIDSSVLFDIEQKLDDLMLAYTIDLSIYHKIDNREFIEHIDTFGQLFFEQ